MSSGERPIGAAKGKQIGTEALCQTPLPSGCPTLLPKMNMAQGVFQLRTSTKDLLKNIRTRASSCTGEGVYTRFTPTLALAFGHMPSGKAAGLGPDMTIGTEGPARKILSMVADASPSQNQSNMSQMSVMWRS